MDVLWYRRARRQGSEARFAEWEVTRSLDRSGAGSVGSVTGEDPPVERAAAISNTMHWAYGTSSAAGYALAFPHPPRWAGLALGAAVWASDYITLPLAGVYKPIWKYDATTLAKDLSAHLVFGAATDGALRVLKPRSARAG